MVNFDNLHKIQPDYVTNDSSVPVQTKIGNTKYSGNPSKTNCIHFVLINVNMYTKLIWQYIEITMNARDISFNYLSFIHGLILFVESLQAEYFKSFTSYGISRPAWSTFHNDKR